MASFRCYDNSGVIKTLLVTNFHLHLIKLWWQFFQMFVCGDVVILKIGIFWPWKHVTVSSHLHMPVVDVDFRLYFCLRNKQWIRIHTRVRYEISTRSVFLNLKNILIEISSIEIFSISSYWLKSCSQKFTDHSNAIWYRVQFTESTNGFAFQIINSRMES